MAKLYFKYGAMNSGKSTILLQTAYNYEELGHKVLIAKPKFDTKGDNKIVSRLKFYLFDLSWFERLQQKNLLNISMKF